jgi:hypothetical protein
LTITVRSDAIFLLQGLTLLVIYVEHGTTSPRRVEPQPKIGVSPAKTQSPQRKHDSGFGVFGVFAGRNPVFKASKTSAFFKRRYTRSCAGRALSSDGDDLSKSADKAIIAKP